MWPFSLIFRTRTPQERPKNGEKPKDRETPDPTDLGGDHLKALGLAIGFSLLILLFLWIFDKSFCNRQFVTALFWALACLGSGMALGFLFGIPRVDQAKRHLATHIQRPSQGNAIAPGQNAAPDSGPKTAAGSNSQSVKVKADAEGAEAISGGGADASKSSSPGSTDSAQSDYGQRVNQNLEEISDWLTKIIVGLGLVELRRIPDHLNSMAVVLAHCLGDGCSEALASALIVWYVVMGFFIGYLPTRIYLAFVFSVADEMSRKGYDHVKEWWKAADDAKKEIKKQTEAGKNEIKKTADESAKVAKEVTQQENVSMQSLNAKEVAAFTRAAFVLDSDETKKAVKNPRVDDQIIADLKSVLAQDDTRPQAAIYLARMYRWKKDDLAAGVQVLTTTINARDRDKLEQFPQLLYNRACYNVLLKPFDPAAAALYLKDNKVKEDLERAFSVSQSLAEDAQTDSDLNTVRSEEWFSQLLTKYTAVAATAPVPTPQSATPAPPPPPTPATPTVPPPESPSDGGQTQPE